MSEMTFEDAKNALSDAAAQDNAATSPGTSAPAPSSPEVQPDAGITEAASPDSFTRSDLGALLEGVNDPSARERIERAYKSFQGDYTRSKQELSQQYGGIDPEQARQSVEFVHALETDPNFVVTVHQQLTKALTEAGYSPAEAHAAASEELGTSLGGQDEEEYGADSGMAKEIAELKAWKGQQEAQQYERDLASRLQSQEMAIRQSDPSLTEPEMDRIYELAFAHGGDLGRAYNAYTSWKQDVLGSYINAKSSTPNIGIPDSTGYATDGPKHFGSLDEAHAAAKEHLSQILANS